MSRSTKFKCPHCDFTCGRNKPFSEHLINEHNYASMEDAYIQTKLAGVKPICKCQRCNIPTKFRGWNKGHADFVSGHNSSLYSYMSEEDAKLAGAKRSEKLKGRVGWSKGLTKETSESLRKAAVTRSNTVRAQFAVEGRTQWNKGLTKESSPGVAKGAEKLKELYRQGVLIPWAKGLTKETSESVAEMSLVVSSALRNKALKSRLDAPKRLAPETIVARLEKHAPDLALITDLSNYTRGIHTSLEFKCKKCNAIQTRSFLSALSNRCEACDPTGCAKQQLEVDRYIASLGIQTELCNHTIISPYEIDIYSEQCQTGIEFNGLYFHSENFKHKGHHSDKSKMCADANVRLIHIFEDEWRDNKDICKSMLAHKLGKSKKSIPARKCSIKIVPPKLKRIFFDNNHLDGSANSKIAFGLYDPDGTLVACISLRRPSHKKYAGMLEIARFCTKAHVHVPGGLSRLTKHAWKYCKENSYESILTYVDTRHGTKAGYTAAGYEFIGTTTNRFWWTDGRERIDRFKIRADKSRGLTEKEVAEELGVVKIWGCPYLIFKYSE